MLNNGVWRSAEIPNPSQQIPVGQSMSRRILVRQMRRAAIRNKQTNRWVAQLLHFVRYLEADQGTEGDAENCVRKIDVLLEHHGQIVGQRWHAAVSSFAKAAASSWKLHGTYLNSFG